MLLSSWTSICSPPLCYLMWKPLALTLSLVFPCIECFDWTLLISGLCLNHSCLAFLYLCGHLFLRSWPSSTYTIGSLTISAKSDSYFSLVLASSFHGPLLWRNYLPCPSLKLAFFLKIFIPSFSSSLMVYLPWSFYLRTLGLPISTEPWHEGIGGSVGLRNSWFATPGSGAGSARSYLIAVWPRFQLPQLTHSLQVGRSAYLTTYFPSPPFCLQLLPITPFIHPIPHIDLHSFDPWDLYIARGPHSTSSRVEFPRWTMTEWDWVVF